MTKYARKHNPLVRPWNFVVKGSAIGLTLLAAAQVGIGSASAQDAAQADVGQLAHVQTAQFKIPFNVDGRVGEALQVQLLVSADDGVTWQAFGSVPAEKKWFEFRAAAEGVYLFKVATIDATGTSFPNPGPPLRVLVDTTKPHSEIRADINELGQLIVDVRVVDENLDARTAVLRIRSDHDSQWRDVQVDLRPASDQVFHGQAITDLAPCREVAVVFSVKDFSLNEGEATTQYSMPRTALGPRDMTLASTKAGDAAEGTARVITAPRLTSTPGATQWTPTPTKSPANSSANLIAQSPGRLAASGQLSLDPSDSAPSEELPLPAAMDAPLPPTVAAPPTTLQRADLQRAELQPADLRPTDSGGYPTAQRAKPLASEEQANAAASVPSLDPSQKTARPSRSDSGGLDAALANSSQSSTIGRAFHCSSRAFSLDYSVEALGGSALADVELWGTEDGGRNWQKWGSDPDRVSPFDVQVGNDGLFGFRMVIVGTNGVVSNRPREGDSADVWINVDTTLPAVKITRAVYGQGPEDGLLVIDYTCDDGHLVDRPITLAFSERAEGPWTQIVSGLANTGIYLWKADPSLPEKIYLKLEAVDKAGNVGTHRLDLPIDVRGLAPRGIIQGFRAIEIPAQ